MLDCRRFDGHAGRAAIDRRAKCWPVAFTPSRDTEQVAETVEAHRAIIPCILAKGRNGKRRKCQVACTCRMARLDVGLPRGGLFGLRF